MEHAIVVVGRTETRAQPIAPITWAENLPENV